MKAGMTELQLVIAEASLQLRLPFEAQPPSPQFKQAGTQPKSVFRGVFPQFVSQTCRGEATASEHRHGSLREKRVATQKSCPERLIKTSCRPFSHKHTCAFRLGLLFCPRFEALSQPSYRARLYCRHK